MLTTIRDLHTWDRFFIGPGQSIDDLPENDFRRAIPRFQSEMFDKNTELLKAIGAMVEIKNVSASELALAWIMAKGIMPIPGIRRRFDNAIVVRKGAEQAVRCAGFKDYQTKKYEFQTNKRFYGWCR